MPVYLIKCFRFNVTGVWIAPLEALVFPQAASQHASAFLRGAMSSSCTKENQWNLLNMTLFRFPCSLTIQRGGYLFRKTSPTVDKAKWIIHQPYMFDTWWRSSWTHLFTASSWYCKASVFWLVMALHGNVELAHFV